MGAVGGGALGDLQKSMAQLREPIFTVDKDEVFEKPIDLESMTNGSSQVVPALKVETVAGNAIVNGTHPGPWTLTSQADGWTSAIAFTNVTKTAKESFEMRVEHNNIHQSTMKPDHSYAYRTDQPHHTHKTERAHRPLLRMIHQTQHFLPSSVEGLSERSELHRLKDRAHINH